MAFTQADIDALKVALATGARRVRFGDRETEFRSLEEMRALLADMQREVAGLAAPPVFRRTDYRRD